MEPTLEALPLFSGPIKCEDSIKIPLTSVHRSNIHFHWEMCRSTEAKDALTSVSLGV